MKPSDYFEKFESIKPRDKVVIVCRVDHPSQKQKLNQQEKLLRAACLRNNTKVLKVFKHIGPGWDPSWITPAAQYAKERGGAKLLAVSSNVFLTASPSCCDTPTPCSTSN